MDASLTLSDGRTLGYAVYGPPAGHPAFYFHGFPASRLEARIAEPYLESLNIRLVAPDRPGMGLSSFQGDRTVAAWPRDVEQLADALGLRRFGILGVSGGGPYALACAWALPERITSVAVVGGMGPAACPESRRVMPPFSRLMLDLAWRHPALTRVVVGLLSKVMNGDPSRGPSRLFMRLARADRRALRNRALTDVMVASFAEAFRNGVDGPWKELLLYGGPWGFPLDGIRTKVHLWHGECDAVVPPAMSRFLAKELPRCETHFLPEQGHFSLMVEPMGEILVSLAADGSSPGACPPDEILPEHSSR